MKLSAKNRNVIIEKMISTHFDVLVIGGGITGAGIALDAAARGLKTGLIEMQDFASGTSGRSTKLIHGGLRYLKQLEFKLVAEVGKERAIVHKNAPHLTRPEKMLLPLTRNGSLGKYAARIAMWIYEWLAAVKREEKFRYLNKTDAQTIEPLLNRDDLSGGILFYEYRTDDARLTIEVIKTAFGKGALPMNYLKAVSFIYRDEKVAGVEAEDLLSGKKVSLSADYVVNAAGPWVDTLDGLDKHKIPQLLQLTKGVHLVTDYKNLPVKQSMYFDTYDKRMIFLIPREGKTYIGTTDTFYKGEIAHPTVTNEDKNYLLKCVNDFFPGIHLKEEQIESCWAGLRPLVKKPGKKPSEISRKDELFVSPSGLITIAGGKLTGYRKMAQRVVDTVARKMKHRGKTIPECNTAQIQLAGGSRISEEQLVNQFRLPKQQIEKLIARFGSNVPEILSLFQKISPDPESKNDENNILIAQLIYCMENEMCQSPSDFLVRRTGMMYFDKEKAKEIKNLVSNYMRNFIEWKEETEEYLKRKLEESFVEATVNYSDDGAAAPGLFHS